MSITLGEIIIFLLPMVAMFIAVYFGVSCGLKCYFRKNPIVVNVNCQCNCNCNCGCDYPFCDNECCETDDGCDCDICKCEQCVTGWNEPAVVEVPVKKK